MYCGVSVFKIETLQQIILIFNVLLFSVVSVIVSRSAVQTPEYIYFNSAHLWMHWWQFVLNVDRMHFCQFYFLVFKDKYNILSHGCASATLHSWNNNDNQTTVCCSCATNYLFQKKLILPQYANKAAVCLRGFSGKF